MSTFPSFPNKRATEARSARRGVRGHKQSEPAFLREMCAPLQTESRFSPRPTVNTWPPALSPGAPGSQGRSGEREGSRRKASPARPVAAGASLPSTPRPTCPTPLPSRKGANRTAGSGAAGARAAVPAWSSSPRLKRTARAGRGGERRRRRRSCSALAAVAQKGAALPMPVHAGRRGSSDGAAAAGLLHEQAIGPPRFLFFLLQAGN